MCHKCDYEALLDSHGLGCTSNRLRVLEVLGNSTYPLNAQEIFETLNRSETINRVTVYRILDTLVEKKVAEKISGGDRAFRYGLAVNANHQRHYHFYCTYCGNMECLAPGSLKLDMDPIKRTFPGFIEKAEVRLDGICKNCLRLHKNRLEDCSSA